jgi:hypothetical protein
MKKQALFLTAVVMAVSVSAGPDERNELVKVTRRR